MMSMHMSFMLKMQLWLLPAVFEYMILNLYFILNVISLTHLILTQFKFHMMFFLNFVSTMSTTNPTCISQKTGPHKTGQLPGVGVHVEKNATKARRRRNDEDGSYSGWWQLKYFLFSTLTLGKMNPI